MTSTEAKYSFTTKINGDLFTVRGDTAEELNKNLSDAITSETIDYIEAFQEKCVRIPASSPQQPIRTPLAVEEVRDAFDGYEVADVKPTYVPQTPPPVRPATPAAVPQTQQGCKHGPMVFKQGLAGPNAKNPGKPYAMWACTAYGDDQCKPVWAGGNR